MKVGIVGIGFMGMIHYLSYQKVAGVEVVALCEQEQKRLAGDWRDIKGNFGPQGTMMDLSGIMTTSDYDEMLRQEDIDLIDVCLPPSLHAEFVLRALEAGKHVFCEKPMSLNTEDCKRMYDTAERTGQVLMIGHVLPFAPEYRWAYEAIQSGKYGKFLGGHFKRVISDPQWLKGFYDPDRVGGPMLDLHVHDAHYIRLLCGMPTKVTSQGRMRGEVVEYWNTIFECEDPSLVVSATSGTIQQQGRGFTHGFEIQMEEATFLYDFAVIGDEARSLMPLTVLEKDGTVTEPDLGEHGELTAFEEEIKAVAEAVQAGRTNPILDGELARDAIILCQRQTESVVKKATVSV